MLYPTRQDNPYCRCAGNPIAAVLCTRGHLTECHAPYTCAEAGCGHLTGSEFPEGPVALAEAKLRQGLLPPYRLSAEGRIEIVAPPAVAEGGAN